MADLRNQLAEIYVKVVADTKEAEKAARGMAAKEREIAESSRKRAEASKKAQEEVAKLGEKITTRQLKAILKAASLEKLLNKDQIKFLEERAKHEEKNAKFSDKIADKRKRKHEMVESHIMNLMTKFRDYSGRLDDEELKLNKSRNAQKLANYESFLKRASHEHSRFATRLDQRDMTSSTIENMFRGYEKGILIGNKWHKDENTLQRIGRAVGIMGSALNRTKNDSEMAASGFASLQRVSYNLQAVFGVLGGTIGSLGGGLLALVGVAGQAAYSLIAVGSAFASMGAGMIAARIALGGVGEAVSAMLDPQKKLQSALRNTRRELRNLRFDAEESALSQEEAAINLEKAREELARVQDLPPDSRVRRETELQFQQAELNYRRAKARNKEAREDLKKGPAGSGTVDPLAALTKSQKDFAKYLVTLKPLMDQLKEAAASGFLPILQTAIQTLVDKAFPTLESGLNTLGTAMGNASKFFADAFTTPENIKLLQDFFRGSKPIIEAFGRIAGSALGGILGTLKAAQPLTARFTKWVESSAKSFETWGKSDGLQSFLTLAGDVAASLGGVFKSVFGGLKNVLEATFPGGNVNAGAGGILLQWLQKLADGFKAFTGTSEFAGWLQGATRNATTALSSIGTLLKPLFDIASMPEIGEFWTVLRGAADPIKKLLEDGAKAAPEFAAMLVSIVKMFEQFSDSGALEAFFSTLKGITDTVTEVLKFLKPVLDFWGRIHGVLLAVGLAILVAKTTLMIMAGIVGNVFGAIGKTSAAMTKFAVSTASATIRFQGLKKEGLSTSAAILGVGKEFTKTVMKARATRKSAFLVQLARDAGMSTDRLRQLEAQLNKVIVTDGIYNKKRMIAAVQAGTTKGGNPTALSKDPALAAIAKTGGGSRFAGGRAATGLAGGALALGSMGATGGSALASGLGVASMVAAFLPGPFGLISSAALGLTSAVLGAQAATEQAAKDRRDAENQKKIQIKAELVEMTAQNVDTQQSTTDALIAEGVKGTKVQKIIDSAAAKIAGAAISGVTDDKKAFETLTSAGFADVFAKGTGKQQDALIASIETVMVAQAKSFEEAVQTVSPIYSEAGSGGRGVKAIQKYIKDTELDKIQAIDNPETGETFQGTPDEVRAKKAEWAEASRRRSAVSRGKEKVAPLDAAMTSLNDFFAYSGSVNKDVWNDKVYQALGLSGKNEFERSISFSKKYEENELTGVINRDKLRTDLKPLIDAYNNIIVKNSSNAPLQPAGTRPSILAPGAPFTPPGKVSPTGLPYIPSAPGAPVASAGPTGKVGDPLTVSDISLKGLGPAISKLANATPNVMVVNVKNKSELDALYRKLGLPSGT